MEAADDVSGNIVKGKRTKRQRVQSPVPFALATYSSSIDDAIGDTTDGIAGDITDGIAVGDANDCLNTKNSTNVSPVTSQEFLRDQESTEEEEDMANCLILLAQGNFKDSPKVQQDKQFIATAAAGIYQSFGKNNNIVLPSTTALMANNGNKFSSRKFMETIGSGGAGKGGYYVYECKTCCRTFPSFQALGGHRASHKKPKVIINNYNYDDKKQFTVNSSDEEDVHNYKDISSLHLQLTNNSNSNNHSRSSSMNLQHNMKSKIHECSICGAEFTSGQALGGHMRRHRTPAAAAAAASNTKNVSLTAMAMESEQSKKSRNLLSLDLDLNLPAPDEDKLNQFTSSQQQQQKQDLQQQQKSPLVFSSPALVDCHY